MDLLHAAAVVLLIVLSTSIFVHMVISIAEYNQRWRSR